MSAEQAGMFFQPSETFLNNFYIIALPSQANSLKKAIALIGISQMFYSTDIQKLLTYKSQ